MARFRMLLRLLIALSWAGGMFGLAWEIRTVGPFNLVSLAVDTLNSLQQASPSRLAPMDAEEFNNVIAHTLLNQFSTWTTWYWSPLNIGYWARALFYFTPAVFLTLLYWAVRARP